MKKKLTPEAQEIQDEYDKKKYCIVCNGKGVYYDNTPIGGIKQICFSCRGTGEKFNYF